MSMFFRVIGLLALCALAACDFSPLEQIPPGLPSAAATVNSDVTDAGRVQSIAVNPTNSNNAIIAMQFGGMWRTFDDGATWFRIYSLPEVYVTDVEYGSDGQTVVASVFRDNRTQNGGGIYVSHTNGDFWSRPATGAVPASPWMPGPTSAYSVSHAPDERGLWYVGTDYGVAVSRDDGATWTHVAVPSTASGDKVQSVLAFPGGRVLAMTSSAVYRSDDRGATWRLVIQDNFGSFAPAGGNVGNSGNKMDRSPFQPWAFILAEYHYKAQEPGHGSGVLWFYELDTGVATRLALPQGRSRGPFVRVSKDDLDGGRFIRIWVGEGWDGYYVDRQDAASIRALRSDAQQNDWASFIAEAGVHADMGDLGLDGNSEPVLLGSDGGIFKPRQQKGWWEIGGHHKWMSAAVPFSGMNSLQVSDLAGTDFTQPDGQIQTSLYFTTQDNRIWGSPDGGITWPAQDTQEGCCLEGRAQAKAGESAQIAYVRIGGDSPSVVFADAGLVHPHGVPDVDDNGQPLDQMQHPYFVSQQPGASDSDWIRLRSPGTDPLREVYFSTNGGNNWRKVAIVNFKSAGEIRSAGGVSWLPVFLGGPSNPVGLVPLTPQSPTVLTYDDSDAVRLPGGGSIGQRFTEWDTHAVYAVDPRNWAHLIVPDIVADNMKVTRDGGKTWVVDSALTAEVLKGGSLEMWGGKPDLMEVTEIAFDPYQPGRILVGTRDAGIVCSADDGRTWRTIYESDRVDYITAFHFHPSGGVYISSYGQGLWYLKAVKGCPKSYNYPWDRPAVHPGPVTGGVAERAATVPPPPPPRGIANPDALKLFLTSSQSSGPTPVLGDDGRLGIAGRGFPAGRAVVVRISGASRFSQAVQIDKDGQFAFEVQLPPDLPYGTNQVTIVSGAAGKPLTTGEFIKAYNDESRRLK